MPGIEALGVDAVDLALQLRQVRLRRLQHEVEVIAHKAPGQRAGIEVRHRPAGHRQQRGAVFVVDEDRLAPVARRGDVVQRARELDAKRPGHRRTLRTPRPDPAQLRNTVAVGANGRNKVVAQCCRRSMLRNWVRRTRLADVRCLFRR